MSKVVEFELAGPSAEDASKLVYILGLNLAAQLPKDLKSLLTKDELEIAMKGLTDMMTDRIENPQDMLVVSPLKLTSSSGSYDIIHRRCQTYGDQLNELLTQRATKLQDELNVAGTKFLENAKAEPGAKTTTGGVVVIPIAKGSGQYPTSASSVKVHYTGMLSDGTVFDSSVTRGEPATFALKQVIKGWQEGLQEMQEGQKCRLVIPADLGYGAQGQPQAGIPGGATLVFEVELIKVLSGGVGGLIL
jgi:FKBP-type peptidyl-prolyl cis-trans isomerase